MVYRDHHISSVCLTNIIATFIIFPWWWLPCLKILLNNSNCYGSSWCLTFKDISATLPPGCSKQTKLQSWQMSWFHAQLIPFTHISFILPFTYRQTNTHTWCSSESCFVNHHQSNLLLSSFIWNTNFHICCHCVLFSSELWSCCPSKASHAHAC